MSYPYKTVLITGATSGLGLALAEKMIEENIFVIAVGRREDRLISLKEKYGAERIAVEPFDMTDLDGMPSWVKKYVVSCSHLSVFVTHYSLIPCYLANVLPCRMTKSYPTLDAIFLNAGIQRSISFTRPESISLPLVQQELTTNYTAPLFLTTLFMPHLLSLAPQPTSIVLVTSGLALVPLPRCANYCATKAALRSLAMTLRHQLAAGATEGSNSGHIKVVEIVPPAVRTELHTQQPDLAAAGVGPIGLTIKEFLRDAWAGLCEGKEEIPVGDMLKARCASKAEQEKKSSMLELVTTLKNQGMDA